MEEMSAGQRAWHVKRTEPKAQSRMEAAVLKAARSRRSYARSRGIPFDEDLPSAMLQRYRETGGRCEVSGLTLADDVLGHGAAPRPFQPSVDRIDSTLGYTKDNCRLVCWAVNCFCGTWGLEIATEIAHGIVSQQGAKSGNNDGNKRSRASR